MVKNWEQLKLMSLNLSWSDIFSRLEIDYTLVEEYYGTDRKENLITWCAVLICDNIDNDHFFFKIFL